jgi:hypothetical protein
MTIFNFTGLQFLKSFIPALDSLESDNTELTRLLSPTAVFIMNNGPPAPAPVVVSQLAGRGKVLDKFWHDITRAWDVEADTDGKGTKRTVLFESVSTTILKLEKDPEQKEVKVAEFAAVTLEACSEGYWATEIKSWLDPSPVRDRMKASAPQPSA